jgi:hypothetical protein
MGVLMNIGLQGPSVCKTFKTMPANMQECDIYPGDELFLVFWGSNVRNVEYQHIPWNEDDFVLYLHTYDIEDTGRFPPLLLADIKKSNARCEEDIKGIPTSALADDEVILEVVKQVWAFSIVYARMQGEIEGQSGDLMKNYVGDIRRVIRKEFTPDAGSEDCNVLKKVCEAQTGNVTTMSPPSRMQVLWFASAVGIVDIRSVEYDTEVTLESTQTLLTKGCREESCKKVLGGWKIGTSLDSAAAPISRSESAVSGTSYRTSGLYADRINVGISHMTSSDFASRFL